MQKKKKMSQGRKIPQIKTIFYI